MTYIGPSSTSVAGSFTSNPNNDAESPVNDFECQNFYIAKCGDGVQDNPNKA